jgi:branched-chain amino acid transport system ATP-binding protein
MVERSEFMPDAPPILVISNLQVHYGVQPALHDISLTVAAGGITALLGPNGAGKTTTVRAVSQMLSVYNGRIVGGDIQLGGESIRGWKPHRVVAAGVGQAPEGRKIFGQMTVDENLRAGAASRPKRNIAASRGSVFDLFPVLAKRRDSKAGWLSGGEQQMLAIGRALMTEPRLLLIDELSLGLAPRMIDTIYDRLQAIHDELKTSILLVEQNASIAVDFATDVYVIDKGRLILSGPSREFSDMRVIRDVYLGGAEQIRPYDDEAIQDVGAATWI